MLPEIDAVSERARLLHKLLRIWKACGFPGKAAGIRMSLPSRLQSNHITRNLPLTKLMREFENIILAEMLLGPIPESKSPLGRIHAATAEEVIALHRLHHGWSGEAVNIDTSRPG